MSAHARRTEVPLVHVATTDDEWASHMAKKGLRVVDAFAKWAGPCEPMQNIFKRLKIEYAEDVVFFQAQTDHIEVLKNLRNRSCPTFLFFFSGILVKMIRGANAPLIEKTIKEQLELEKNGQPHQQLIFDERGAVILAGPNSHGDHAGGNHAGEFTAPVNMHGSSEISAGAEHAATATTGAIAVAAEGAVTETIGDDSPSQETLAIIKPDAMNPGAIEQIMDIIRINRFEVVKRKKMWMSNTVAREFYKEHADKLFYESLVTYLTAAPVLALVLRKSGAIAAWRALMGPASSIRAKESAPKSLRAQFGTDSRLNAVFGSLNDDAAAREIGLLFGESNEPGLQTLAMSFDESEHSGAPANIQKTLAIVKPDAVAAGKAEEIVERIICRGYQVIKREEVTLTQEAVNEIYASMKEDPSFADMSAFLISAPSLALVLKGDSVVAGWREMLGPVDPVAAKESMPMSMRALFGTDMIHNAVHGSMTSDDAVREIHVVFPLVLKRSGSNVFASRPGTASNPYPTGHRESQSEMHARLERTLALIKPDAYPQHKDAIVAKIRAEGFTIVKETEYKFAIEQAREFYKEHDGKPFYDELVGWMSTTPIYAMVLEKENAIGGWRQLAGPTNSVKAKEIAPGSVRAMFGTDGSHNAVHGSDAPASAAREITIVFGDTVSATPEPLQHTLALIKPDAYPTKKDDILSRIRSEGFEIVKESEVRFTAEQAKEFYKEHDGKPFYDTLVGWMSSAPIYAMVLEKKGAIKAWRALAGPTNSVKARETSPESIRALHGKDGSENAVHGSDSSDSAKREIGVVFGAEFAAGLEPMQPSHAHLVQEGTASTDATTAPPRNSTSRPSVTAAAAPAATDGADAAPAPATDNSVPPKAPISRAGSSNKLAGSKSNLARHQSVPSVAGKPAPTASASASRTNLQKTGSQARVGASASSLTSTASKSRQGLSNAISKRSVTSSKPGGIAEAPGSTKGSKSNLNQKTPSTQLNRPPSKQNLEAITESAKPA